MSLNEGSVSIAHVFDELKFVTDAHLDDSLKVQRFRVERILETNQ